VKIVLVYSYEHIREW